jgi:DNA-directed RNA polymerase beta subunit
MNNVLERPWLEPLLTDPSVLDVRKYLSEHTQTEDIVSGYNEYILTGLKKQLASAKVPYKKDGKNCFMIFRVENIIPPRYKDNDEVERVLYPAWARTAKLDYMATIIAVPVGYQVGNPHPIETGKPVEFARIPVMVRSILCNTHGITDPEDLARIGENPNDPGGYFLYRGNVNTIPGIEKLRINRPFLYPKKGNDQYERVRQTINVSTGTAVNEIIEKLVDPSSFIKACHFATSKMKQSEGPTKRQKVRNSLNIFNLIDIIGHVFGRPEIREKSTAGTHYAVPIILSFICTEDEEKRRRQVADVLRELSGTIFEYENGRSTAQAMSDLLTWLDTKPDVASDLQKYETLVDFIQNHVFESTRIRLEKIQVDGETISRYKVEPKINLLCFLTCQFLLYKTGHLPLTNKDDWSNKKVDSAIVYMSQNFWDGYKRYVESLKKGLVSRTTEVSSIDAIAPDEANRVKTLTSHFLAPFNKIKEEGTTGSAFEPSQKVIPTNVIDLINSVTKIQVDVNKKVKSRGLRNIQGSQYGYVCPAKTPDGIKCGMVKWKAMLSHITTEVSVSPIVAILRSYGFIAEKRSLQYFNVLIMNEQIVGWCNGRATYDLLSRMRKGSPAAFIASLDDPVLTVKAKWYPFDARRALDLIIQNKIIPSRRDGFDFELQFEGETLGYVPDSVVLEIQRESSIPRIHKDTTFSLNEFGHVCVYTDAGRLVRPMYVVRDNRKYLALGKDDVPKFELLVDTKEYDTTSLSFAALHERGFVDYIDPYEESNPDFYHAVDRQDFYEKLRRDEEQLARLLELSQHPGDTEELDSLRRYVSQADRAIIRYVGLHGVGMYGISAASSPLSQHDPAGKTTHTAKTVPQTLGLQSNAYSHKREMYQLISNLPLSIPSVTGSFGDRRTFLARDVPIGFLDLPGNQEDAVLFSSLLIDLGYLQYKKQVVVGVDVYFGAKDKEERLGIPDNLSETERLQYDHLTEQGLPPIGMYLEKGKILVSKYSVDEKTQFVYRQPTFVDEKEGGRVIDIIIRPITMKDNEIPDKVHVSILLEIVGAPIVGDKFSLMHGQKSVVGGKIVPHEDLPQQQETGTAPLVLFNTHAMKNRQTFGVVMEMILGVKAAVTGKAYDTTAYVPYSMDKLIEELQEQGHAFNRAVFNEGTRGYPYFGWSYVGYSRLQQLHHFAKQKISAVNYSEVDVNTGRKKKGAKAGGQKMGGMEANVIIAYSAWAYFREKFRIRSDNYIINSCKECEIFTNKIQTTCPNCGASNSLYRIETTEAYRHLQDIALMQNMRIYSSVGTDEEFAEYYETFAKSLNEQPEETFAFQDEIEEDEEIEETAD